MEFSGTTGSARGAEIRENGSWSCAPASGLFFLPIKDQLTVRLEGSKACLEGSQHRHRYLGGVTILKRACNVIALAGNTVLAFGDEPFSPD